jgi:hypothetical protein
MVYVREFQTGTGKDPRDKWFAVYHCDACGHEEWIHMYDRYAFDKRPRECPKCHSLGVEDLRKNLEARRAALLDQESKVRAEIEKVIKEIEQLERKPA